MCFSGDGSVGAFAAGEECYAVTCNRLIVILNLRCLVFLMLMKVFCVDLCLWGGVPFVCIFKCCGVSGLGSIFLAGTWCSSCIGDLSLIAGLFYF